MEMWRYDFEINRCPELPVNASETLVNELGLARPAPHEDPVAYRQQDMPQQPPEDGKELSVKERLRRARLQESLTK